MKDCRIADAVGIPATAAECRAQGDEGLPASPLPSAVGLEVPPLQAAFQGCTLVRRQAGGHSPGPRRACIPCWLSDLFFPSRCPEHGLALFQATSLANKNG